ncbi:MAG: hypothetical protein ACUVRR_02705, partial [Candidatus Fervidibacter sp.]
ALDVSEFSLQIEPRQNHDFGEFATFETIKQNQAQRLHFTQFLDEINRLFRCSVTYRFNA